MNLITGCYFFAAVPGYKYTLSECILCNDEGKQVERHIYGLQKKILYYPYHSCGYMYLPAQYS